MLYARLLRAEKPRARILSVSLPELPEGYFIIDRHDVPGLNRIALVKTDWPAYAEDVVNFAGEIIMIIAGPDKEEILRIQSEIKVEYDDLTPAFTLDEAARLKGEPLFGSDNLFADYQLRKGEPEKAFDEADQIFEETLETGFQEHLYLETQSLVAAWENDKIVIYGSLQCPYYVKKAVCTVLGCPETMVRVVQTPTGGGFGGKEDYPEVIGAPPGRGCL